MSWLVMMASSQQTCVNLASPKLQQSLCKFAQACSHEKPRQVPSHQETWRFMEVRADLMASKPAAATACAGSSRAVQMASAHETACCTRSSWVASSCSTSALPSQEPTAVVAAALTCQHAMVSQDSPMTSFEEDRA